ncbi:MAG: hypothetical protein JW734_08690 [Candidatus Omnitrophica bacterium]|nr:hypothetical protein [Candidatus Omnitrophota bacterium]
MNRAVLEITTNIGCSNFCPYCPQDILKNSYLKRSDTLAMDFSLFKACLDKVPTDVDIHFSGFSEPWLNPECTRMLLYAKDRGHRLEVSTTLKGLSPSDIEFIEDVVFRYFRVHLPSQREEIEVDKDYLGVLLKLSESRLKVFYHFHGDRVHPKVKAAIKENIVRWPMLSRGGNLKKQSGFSLEKKGGTLRCFFSLRQNVLLPNGDVTLCCSDYGLKHILGNLLSANYDSLFLGREFIKVKKGLEDESLDILCRFCDRFGYNSNHFKLLKRYWAQIKNIYSLNDLCHRFKVLF